MAGARKASASKGLRVTAPLVQARVGDRNTQFHVGDFLPEGVDPESVEHLKSLGYVEEIDVPATDES